MIDGTRTIFWYRCFDLGLGTGFRVENFLKTWEKEEHGGTCIVLTQWSNVAELGDLTDTLGDITDDKNNGFRTGTTIPT